MRKQCIKMEKEEEKKKKERERDVDKSQVVENDKVKILEKTLRVRMTEIDIEMIGKIKLKWKRVKRKNNIHQRGFRFLYIIFMEENT